MTRTEALYKLLAIEPATKDELYAACGWCMFDLESALSDLCSQGKVTWQNKWTARYYMVK